MIASDNATFFADLANEGWHVIHGRVFLCRRNNDQWENALVQHFTNFPDQEVDEGDPVASAANILWVEPEDWKPLNLAPNTPAEEGLQMIIAVGAIIRFRGRDNQFKLFEDLVKFCRGKTHRQVITELQNMA